MSFACCFSRPSLLLLSQLQPTPKSEPQPGRVRVSLPRRLLLVPYPIACCLFLLHCLSHLRCLFVLLAHVGHSTHPHPYAAMSLSAVCNNGRPLDRLVCLMHVVSAGASASASACAGRRRNTHPDALTAHSSPSACLARPRLARGAFCELLVQVVGNPRRCYAVPATLDEPMWPRETVLRL